MPFRSKPLLILFFIFLISWAAAGQTIARVQNVHSYPSYISGNSVTFNGFNTAGNAIVVVASWHPGTVETPTVSDTLGNTYTALPKLTGSLSGGGEPVTMAIWYALNIAGGSNTVTIAGLNNDDAGMTAVEYSGVATSAAIGITSMVSDFGNAQTTTPTSNTFSPGTGSLLFVAFADETKTETQSTMAAGAGYTLVEADGAHIDIEEDNLSSSPGQQTATFTVGVPSSAWIMYVVEFLPAGSAGSLPPVGTVLWSNPGDGSGFASIVPAVPSATGAADVFGLQNDGTIAAITSDGTTAWTYAVPSASGNPPWTNGLAIPDFQGGVIVVDYLANQGSGSIRKIDGVTGQAYPAYNVDPNDSLYTSNPPLPPPVVHTDGTVFAIQTEQFGEWRGSVVGIDSATGAQKFRVPVPIPQPDYYCGYSGTSYNASSAGATGLPNIVAGDGNYYFAFAYDEFSNCVHVATHLRLLQVSSSGASNLFTILDANPPIQDGSRTAGLTLGLISNADAGVVLTWSLTFGANGNLTTQFGMAITTGTSVNVVSGPSVPGQQTSHPDDGTATGLNPVVPVLQREDGSFIGSVLFQTNPQQTNMVAFDSNGNVLWVVPNETPQIATADGGVIGQSGTVYDQNGNVTGQTNNAIQSWRGDMYLTQGSAVDQVYFAPNILAKSLTAWPWARTTASRPWFFMIFWQNNCSSNTPPCGFTLYPDNPQNNPALAIDATSQAVTMKFNALAALKKAFDKYPVTVGEISNVTGDNRANVVDGMLSQGGVGSCGSSSPIAPSHDSSVYYRENMEQAQWALPITLNTAADVQNALQNASLMKAIGIGIGNNAAHELAHQFFGSGFGMDDTSKNTYNGQDCRGDNAPWVYGVGPIKLEIITDDAWKATLGAGWHR
jgi:hypothetical protein